MKIKTLSLLIVSLVTFSGCGDSGNSTTVYKSVSGSVADGYLVGATVCLDKNLNNVCDSNEPNTQTTIHGQYTLTNLTNDDISNYPILVEVDTLVRDEDDNSTIAQYYTLTATPGQTFISPISTMIRNYEITNNTSSVVAREKIEELLGISDVSLSVVDYMASDSAEAEEVHEKAKIIANLKMNILTDVKDDINNTDYKVVDKYINDKIMAKLSNIKIEVDDNSDLNTSVTNIMGTIDLSSASTELDNTELNTTTVNNSDIFDIEWKGVGYNKVTSPYTGKIWLDRNLGASKVCEQTTDTDCKGDYYQWGRATNGHEKLGSATTKTRIKSLDNSAFYKVYPMGLPTDWLDNSYSNINKDYNGSKREEFWSRTDGTSVCPIGYRVPSSDELAAETIDHDFNKVNLMLGNFLKMIPTGKRGGYVYLEDRDEISIWSSTARGVDVDAKYLHLTSRGAYLSSTSRSYGIPVRCIKN
jgi:hypothetical protein